tara:strand:- start:784 stop:1320 length:537 start_codon:yes stop_codon:yes gene_type:complete
MFKVLPIFIIFFLTGLFLLKVDNLTQKKDAAPYKNLNIEETSKSENQDEITLNPDEDVLVENKLNSINIEKKKNDGVIDETKNLEKKLEVEDNQKDKVFTKKFSVQFGAFSKEIGAKKLKDRVDKIIKPKFDFFESYIQFNDEKKIYFLKFDSDSKENVNETCKFSKLKEIDCYVIQR